MQVQTNNGAAWAFKGLCEFQLKEYTPALDDLTRANELPDEDGSFMTVVHKTIMDVRSLFNGLDESVLPGLIDGEKRNVAKYDEALELGELPANLASLLTRQRDGLLQKIAQMQTQSAASEKAS